MHRKLFAITALGTLAAAASICGAAPARRNSPKASAPLRITALRASPASIHLAGAYSSARLLVDGIGREGSADFSDRVKLQSADPSIAWIDPEGAVRPRHNGKTQIVARLGAISVKTPVQVSGIVPGAAPDFVNDVLPVITHAGCNMGACHGAASGKGGFKLSLLAYDPDLDYEAITRASGARRISRSQPENSLILRKPTCETPHRGGVRIVPRSPDYHLIADWIADGCPGPNAKAPHLAGLQVLPAVRTLKVGETQQFTVRAVYSDGSARDATTEAVFTASDESTASVSASGVAKAAGPGEGGVVVRYQGIVATARVVSPFGPPINRPLPAAGADTTAEIDRLVQAKLNALGLTPSPGCTDGDFLRRASLDLIGELPSPDEVRAFLADKDPMRRTKLVDSLLARPEFVDYWTLQWADLLKCSRQALTEKGMFTLNAWIHNAVYTNMPWDKFARDIILSTGDTYRSGPANFYRASGTAEERAEATSQVFLGVRIACAKCHNHPYDRWTQNQYYQFSAFFARLATKKGDSAGDVEIYPGTSGEERNPRSHQTVEPCALVDSQPLPATFADDRREPLADWITSPRNPFFSHSIADRIWKNFMGRGFIDAVDDMKATSPPSNGPLFDFLASDLAAHHYDLKHLMRSIVLSRAYQRSAAPVGNNAADRKFYSHFLFKRMGAEQMLDALSTVTGVQEKFNGYPAGTRAEELPDTQTPSYFLDLFGRPARSTTCACERSDDPNLSQVLHLMNSADVNSRLSSKTGRISALMAAKLPDNKMVEELYLACYSRYPTAAEMKRDLPGLSAAKDKRAAVEDIAWALINSNEFVLNH